MQHRAVHTDSLSVVVPLVRMSMSVSAMQMTAVYSCVRILSEAVASLPLHVYKYNSEGGKGEIIALYPLMPNRNDGGQG